MKILLINNNPVVSRLTALSARKENISLDEIKNISELKESDYNIIFVDGESYNNDVSNIIRNAGVEKRVLFYAEGEEQNQSIFTQSILKPFLPSEVSEILRETKVALLKSKKENKEKKDKKENVNFEDLVEENKEKELEFLNIMEEKEPTVALASSTVDSTTNDKKADVVKKDVTKKDEFDLKIEEAFPISLDDNKEKKMVEKEPETHKKDMFDLDSDLFELDTKKESTPSNKEDELFKLDNKKKSLKDGFEENIFDENLFEIDKEMKKDILNDLPLDFDIDSKDEVGFSPNAPKTEEEPKIEKVKQKLEEPKLEEPKLEEKKVKEDIKMTEKSEVTTKVLNNEDIADIMDILDEKEGSEKLTEIPTSLMKVQESVTEKSVDTKESVNIEEISKQKVLEKEEIIEERVKEKKIQEEEIYSDELSTGDAIAYTLSRLPVKELRQLLRGAKINISIEFSHKI